MFSSFIFSKNHFKVLLTVSSICGCIRSIITPIRSLLLIKLKAIPGQMRDLFEIMNPNKNQPEPEKVPA